MDAETFARLLSEVSSKGCRLYCEDSECDVCNRARAEAHDIHEGFCYTHQVWLTRPGELEAHMLGG